MLRLCKTYLENQGNRLNDRLSIVFQAYIDVL
jgi:hypothetical protein